VPITPNLSCEKLEEINRLKTKLAGFLALAIAKEGSRNDGHVDAPKPKRNRKNNKKNKNKKNKNKKNKNKNKGAANEARVFGPSRDGQPGPNSKGYAGANNPSYAIFRDLCWNI
jgi:hypothetical protein